MKLIFDFIVFFSPALFGFVALASTKENDRGVRALRLSAITICLALFCVCLLIVSSPGAESRMTPETLTFLTQLTLGFAFAIPVLLVGPNLISWYRARYAGSNVSTGWWSTGGNKSSGVVSDWCVLFVGDGHVGKTQMIRTLSANFETVDPSNRTGDGDQPRFVISRGPIYGSKRLIFIDHRGQDFGSIGEALTHRQLSGADIRAIVFMVDLFGYPPKSEMTEAEWKRALWEHIATKEGRMDQTRVEKHKRELSRASLDQLFSNNGIVVDETGRSGLQTLSLFVNKIDKFEGWDGDTKEETLLEPFDQIWKDLRARVSAIQKKQKTEVSLNWCAGSALHGLGILGKDNLLASILDDRKENEVEK